MQKEIDFNKPIIHYENNVESQEHFESNERHFNKQCLITYKAMLQGVKLTTASALLKYGIGDLRRRVKDLKDDHGIDVKSKWIRKNGSRYKEYFLENGNNPKND